jgi:hypothetical protein
VVVAAISVVAEVCVAVWIEDVAVVWTVEWNGEERKYSC